MLVPYNESGWNLRKFLAKYFIEDTMSDIVMEDQDVIVTYYDEQGVQHGPPAVRKKYKSFDIYVKQEHLYDCDDDRMRDRAKRIAQKIKEILTAQKHLRGLSFTYVDEYTLGTRMVGFIRYHIQFSYFTTS